MSRRATVWLAAGVAALVVAAVAAALFLLTRPSGPDAAVRAYLEALADGDADRALAALDEPDDGVDRAAALAGATARISSPEIVGYGYPAGTDSAGVAARFELDGRTHDLNVGLERVDGRWRIRDTGLATVELTTDLGEAVRVGDAVVGAGTVALLPAVYPVRATPDDVLTGETTAVAVPGTTTTAAVDAELSPAAASLAQEQVDAYATRCAARASTVAQACGFVIPWTASLATLDAVAYRIETLPELSLSADGRSFAATGGEVVATVTGTAHDGAAASLTYRDDDWSLRGVVEVTADGLVLGVR